MGLRQGALTASRFFVDGEPPEDQRRLYTERLALRVMQPLRADEEAEERWGWCAVSGPGDLVLSPDKVFVGSYILLGVRHDKYRFPPAVVQAHTEELAQSKGKAFSQLPARQKKELKARAVRALRSKLLPMVRHFEVAWNTERGQVHLFSQSAGVREQFAELFERTFDLAADWVSPYLVASRPATSAERLERLAACEMSAFSEPCASAPDSGLETTRPPRPEEPRGALQGEPEAAE